MAAAVGRLQQDYGLKVDGVVGDNTLETLNEGAADRARILAINLERLRWLDRTPPATRIDVNTAAAMLAYWHEGAHAHRARSEEHTSELQSLIRNQYAVLSL